MRFPFPTLFGATLALVCLFSPSIALAKGSSDLPKVEPLTKLKKLYPRTELVESGKPRALLVVPDTPGLGKVADEIRKTIQQLTGARLTTVRPEDLIDKDWQIDHQAIGNHHLIALGNVNTNRLLAVLWGEGYAAADSLYPGQGGYVVRTVHDPFATGINVLVLGGSDTAGVERAAAALGAKHLHSQGKSLALAHPIVEVENHSVEHSLLPNARSQAHPQNRDLRWAQKELQKAGFMNKKGEVVSHKNQKLSCATLTSQLSKLSQAYFFTGNNELLPLMKALVDENRRLLGNPALFLGMSARTATHVPSWDLLEELPIWDDRDRLEITNALLADAKLGHERRQWHQAVRDGTAVQTLDENHGTFSAGRSFLPWNYFHKYYKSPASEYWMRATDAVFSGQSSTYQILEDGSTYLGYTPGLCIPYAVRKRDLTYLQRGIAHEYARYISIACMNNLGLTTGFGDTSNVLATTAFGTLGPTAWFYRDPHLTWILQNKFSPNQLLARYENSIPVNLDVRPKEPTAWTGVTRFPIYENPLNEIRHTTTPIFAERKEVDPKLFNKIVFKENWDDNGQYLLLDGAGQWGNTPGPHGHKHDDINTIINYTDEGRMWRDDHTYEDRAFVSHSGAFLSHKGSIPYSKTELAKLEHQEENDTFAMTETSFGNWTRRIYWKKGRYFLVVDRLVAPVEGEYVARCNFKGLGEPTLEGSNLLLEQQSRYCRILSSGNTKAEVVDVPFMSRGIWERDYPYAQPVARMFRQDKVVRLQQGEAVTFVNLIHASSSKKGLDQVTMHVMPDASVLVKDENAPTLFGSGNLPGGAGRAAMYIVSGQGDSLTTRSQGTLSPADLKKAVGATKKLAKQAKRKSPQRKPKAKRLVQGIKLKTIQLDSPITVLLSVDLNHDGREEWLCGGPKGVRHYSTQGKQRWAFDTSAAVRALAAGELNGDGEDEVVFGADDEQIRALNNRGKPLWSYTCKGADASRFGRPTVDYVQIVDLDQSGQNEVVAGAHWIHVLSGEGTLQWEQSMRMARNRIQGDFIDAEVSDIDGDGRLDISAAFKAGYSTVRTVDDKGHCLMPLQFQGRFFGQGNVAEHQGLTVSSPIAVRTVSLPSPHLKKRLVACAAQRGLQVFWHDQKDKHDKIGNVSGTFTAMEALKTGPEENPALILSNSLYGVVCYEVRVRPETRKIKLRQKWYRTLDAKITAIKTADLNQDGVDEVYVGTASGSVHVLDSASGQSIGLAQVPGSAVVSFSTSKKPGTLFAAQQEGTVMVLQR